MRAVKKFLQKLTQSSCSELTTKNESTAKCLSRVGDHILTIIDRCQSNEVAKKRKTELWNFVAQFSKLDAEALHSMYQNCHIPQKDSLTIGKGSKMETAQSKHPTAAETEGNKSGGLNRKVRESVFEKKQSSKTKPPFQPRISRESSPPHSFGHQRKRIFEQSSKAPRFTDEGHPRISHHSDSQTDREKSRLSKSGDPHRRSQFQTNEDSEDYRRNSSMHDPPRDSFHHWERPRHFNAPKSRSRGEHEGSERFHPDVRNKHWNCESDGRKSGQNTHWYGPEQKVRENFERDVRPEGPLINSRDPRTMKYTQSEHGRYSTDVDQISTNTTSQWHGFDRGATHSQLESINKIPERNSLSVPLNLPHGAIAIDLNTPHSSEIADIKLNNNLVDETCPSPEKEDSLKGENLDFNSASKSPDSIQTS